ncbi:tetraacyldisaccharide 4'-kinase [Candidatus Poribacteria bacterium]|nr:tetraacyldisaccharide 4'-kinase [Candidatus Poribacteria bacterium]
MKNIENYYKKLNSSEKKNLFDKIVLLFLEFFSWIYAVILFIHELLYKINFLKSTKLKIPVISIGNITMGGTGKTSMVITIARMLQKQQADIAILSRGYKGKLENKWGLVSDGNKTLLSAEEAGDEPVLIANKLPGVKVLVGKDRGQTGTFAQEKLNSKLIILDDGFQQKKLDVSVNIVLLDAVEVFGNYKLFPRGILRQPISTLEKSDIIIITNSNINEYGNLKDEILQSLRSFRMTSRERCHSERSEESAFILNELKKYASGAKIFSAEYHPIRIRNLADNSLIEIKNIRDKSILAVTGIAHPEYFKYTIEKLLNKGIKSLYYPDHYKFSKEDFKEIERKAKNFNSEIILITEKDAVKFIPISIPVYVVEVEMKINDEAKFREALSEFLALS